MAIVGVYLIAIESDNSKDQEVNFVQPTVSKQPAEEVEPAPSEGNKVYAKKRGCPEEWISNQMPRSVEPGSQNEPPSEYYIVDGKRAELTEYDTAWVEQNCNIKKEIVY